MDYNIRARVRPNLRDLPDPLGLRAVPEMIMLEGRTLQFFKEDGSYRDKEEGWLWNKCWLRFSKYSNEEVLDG